jgi:hypothetical protein
MSNSLCQQLLRSKKEWQDYIAKTPTLNLWEKDNEEPKKFPCVMVWTQGIGRQSVWIDYTYVYFPKPSSKACHVERWDGEDFTVVVSGIGPVGGVLSKKDAQTVANWLPTAIQEIQSGVTQDP